MKKIFSFTVGFVFSPDLETVMLIEKDTSDKPSQKWQDGLLNGVGGKIENGESAKECMIRECHEEFGVYIENWYELGNIIYRKGVVSDDDDNLISLHVYRTVVDYDTFYSIHQTGREKPVPVKLTELLDRTVRVVPNLEWIIPAARYENFLGNLSIELPNDVNEPFLKKYVPKNL